MGLPASTQSIGELAAEHGLSAEEYTHLLEILGREPNLVELGIFSVMWSEHCSYKSTRKHLAKLPTEGPQVICGPGENAGVVDIGDGQAAIFKMESHNHPSFIEPYQGAATGVGGIMRDVFTMGARPVALLNALRFGSMEAPRTRHLLSGVVAGVGGYGNCMGVPTVGGECEFHPSYNENNLVNAMCVGLADATRIFYSAASSVGAPILYAGSKTGRDGIHGATMASAEFDENSEEKRPTVQVGDPFTQKRLMEACLELMQEEAIMAIQDMGAAGLTCSSLEMADKGGTGVELNLDLVPVREKGMTPYEIMLSESQERMLMVIQPGKESVAARIFDRWEIDHAVIGRITDTGRMVLRFAEEVVTDIPVAPLSEEAPLYDRPWTPAPAREALEVDLTTTPEALIEHLQTMLASPAICSKRWVFEQYDSQVMNDTVQGPGGDAAIVRIHGSEKALALTSDCTPRYCLADPVEGGKQAVAEAWRNLVASGAKPLAITNCLNFGNPEKPDVMGQIVGCLKGMREACEALDFPVTGGNVSLYNETNGSGILPTPTIGGVGLLQDVHRALTPAFKEAGQTILRIGDMHGHLGSSLYAELFLPETEAPHAPPPVDLEQERKNGEFILFLAEKGWITACHDISDGGQLVALAEMAMASWRETAEGPACIGAVLDVAIDLGRAFGEDQGRYIVTAPHDLADRILTKAPAMGVTATAIGETGSEGLCIAEACISVAALRTAYEGTLPAFAEGN